MDQYRVFGNPIAQSKSPFIHQYFAQLTNQVMNYQSELVALDDFSGAVKRLIANNGKGANITAPFKEQAFKICDQRSERAELAGAVNTLIFENGIIYGDTTDGLGLVHDLDAHGVTLNKSRILLLGAGGAAKGVVQSLLMRSPTQLTIANRTVGKAKDIVSQYSKSPINAVSFDEITMENFDIIINATSAGLSGDSLPIDQDIIKNASTCYDMVYGKSLTPFLTCAQSLGVANVVDGLGMLVGQASESFNLWRGIKPDTSKVTALLRKEMETGT